MSVPFSVCPTAIGVAVNPVHPIATAVKLRLAGFASAPQASLAAADVVDTNSPGAGRPGTSV